MQGTHSPEVIDISTEECLVECPEGRSGQAAEVPIGIRLPTRDRITAELLAESHRDGRRSFAFAGGR